MDNNPPHSLVVVVVGVVEVRYNPSQVSKGWMHRDRYLHLLVNNMDNLVGHIVAHIQRDCPQASGVRTLADGS